MLHMLAIAVEDQIGAGPELQVTDAAIVGDPGMPRAGVVATEIVGLARQRLFSYNLRRTAEANAEPGRRPAFLREKQRDGIGSKTCAQAGPVHEEPSLRF